MSRDSFLIAQLSDLHCGSPFFDAQLLRHADAQSWNLSMMRLSQPSAG